MKIIHPLRTARRKAQRSANPPKPRSTSRTELEHAAGRGHDPYLVAPVCLLHHDQVTEARRDADVSMKFQPNPVMRYALALKALSIFLHMLADAVWRWGSALEQATNEVEHEEAKERTRQIS